MMPPAMPAPTDAPNDPVLSIVVVNWNTRELLLALLKQLSAEPPIAAEILVVDNASSDGSAEAARRDFPSAVVLPQPRNGGFAYGVNRGLERARGEWILLLNTDAQASWPQIQSLLAAAEQRPDAAVFGPRIVDEHGALQPSTWQRHLPRHALGQALFLDRVFPEHQPAGAADVDVVSGCVFLIRRQVLGEVGGFDERFFMYFEEADFCERVRKAGRKVRWVPDATFVHEGGLSAEQAASVTFLAFRESRLLYHAALHGRLATEWVRACLLLGTLLRLLPWCALSLIGRGRKTALYWRTLRQLARPGYVAELCKRPRLVPALRERVAVG
jgi:GT2 family glycosyltransferase